MKLADLLKPWIEQPIPDCEIVGLHNDSREIKPGFLFIAYPGACTDGRLFISRALEAGANAILYDPNNWPQQIQIPSKAIALAMPNLSTRLADIASRFYGQPTKQLNVTGVTGTNGKTTIAYQLAQAHELLGQNAAYIGTIGQGRVKQLQALANTTPDALRLQSLLADYLKDDVKHICMEVSSHALCQGRVEAINFQQAIFTNLSHEHLDYHLTLEAYAKAKSLLFAKPGLKWAIVNQDDAYSSVMVEATNSSCKIIRYGIKADADVRVLDWKMDLKGSSCEVQSPWGKVHLRINALGFFNIYNSLAVFSSLLAYGYPIEQVTATIGKLQAAPGRMEIVSHDPCIIVDYAHTPDALENALATLQKIKKGRIFVVFGCGGDRDKTKRPMMGKIAAEYADLAIMTSDNPRTEDPMSIIEEIDAGMPLDSNRFKIADREEAIAKAIELAEADDILLVAGKGHENYQIIGGEQHHFSDQEIIRKLLGRE
ncbi:UDP-N-acetylmuramoyl-L-alanyl-D-glutamate--2,6-diaminopimelate ligase [Legionella jordanis]|uniref:UDP-N-acetylmuramoyl-L-alanyl-D-glutamate--2,6-diaminopimelate ligase n=1 Tax=Legionella jordanis TaxID=456 RepID=A0A0W0V8L4_9GAMM|nr:UDP-N-acetylmuramoyl-L-alanyl-D-glutamate--2,6-diaminopimelate ligase [Legionella jordanis]KTD16444.1 UDP-N-acetylmuramoylalanyl-D-glutamate-2, 6-diaminopimelate ligase [Legionella jordanis]RMX04004.1 UDP-N-acetylmuramoyl-L-alanyl-D-glutamate--2,6-diaminopimelate ligase [Legionella jordanis]RMX15293.1 UDP-N-acetylmuramoyl-L-alanyl-D-glutamate--2,6-diaminopimelate ligase [Legionella jordanis]VEH12096.1 UDP-N-acetylmuramoylalanyl-D-glutamate-2, 6-diaminopimelate ligase [Legionella jordanis]HA